jgi:hypothetical protein
MQEAEIHLQDYNCVVLELVTFPNVLLAWCTFSSSLFDRQCSALALSFHRRIDALCAVPCFLTRRKLGLGLGLRR